MNVETSYNMDHIKWFEIITIYYLLSLYYIIIYNKSLLNIQKKLKFGV